ncbi:hypothetical protein APHAL10511_000331 [Amanita phalloides]|nr:hypothetical protein APHAL10511_000331 [Amanita phalloides]
MHPSSFVTLFFLITTIFAAPLMNLTSGIDGESGISTSSEDRPIPLQRRDLSQTCVYWAVQKNLGAKVENKFAWMHYLTKNFDGFPAIVRKITARTLQDYRTLHHEIRNQVAVKQLIRVATIKCSEPVKSLSLPECRHYYLVTKNMGVPAKALKGEPLGSVQLADLRHKAIEEYQKEFKLIYSSDDEDNYVYRHVDKEGRKKLEANPINGWAFALPVGVAKPGKPEIFI